MLGLSSDPQFPKSPNPQIPKSSNPQILQIFPTIRPRPASTGDRSTRTRRSEEHTSELQSQSNLVCRLLLEKKKTYTDSPGGRDSTIRSRTDVDIVFAYIESTSSNPHTSHICSIIENQLLTLLGVTSVITA